MVFRLATSNIDIVKICGRKAEYCRSPCLGRPVSVEIPVDRNAGRARAARRSVSHRDPFALPTPSGTRLGKEARLPLARPPLHHLCLAFADPPPRHRAIRRLVISVVLPEHPLRLGSHLRRAPRSQRALAHDAAADASDRAAAAAPGALAALGPSGVGERGDVAPASRSRGGGRPSCGRAAQPSPPSRCSPSRRFSPWVRCRRDAEDQGPDRRPPKAGGGARKRALARAATRRARGPRTCARHARAQAGSSPSRGGRRRRQRSGQTGRGGTSHRPPSSAHPSARRRGRPSAAPSDASLGRAAAVHEDLVEVRAKAVAMEIRPCAQYLGVMLGPGAAKEQWDGVAPKGSGPLSGGNAMLVFFLAPAASSTPHEVCPYAYSRSHIVSIAFQLQHVPPSKALEATRALQSIIGAPWMAMLPVVLEDGRAFGFGASAPSWGVLCASRLLCPLLPKRRCPGPTTSRTALAKTLFRSRAPRSWPPLGSFSVRCA